MLTLELACFSLRYIFRSSTHQRLFASPVHSTSWQHHSIRLLKDLTELSEPHRVYAHCALALVQTENHKYSVPYKCWTCTKLMTAVCELPNVSVDISTYQIIRLPALLEVSSGFFCSMCLNECKEITERFVLDDLYVKRYELFWTKGHLKGT